MSNEHKWVFEKCQHSDNKFVFVCDGCGESLAVGTGECPNSLGASLYGLICTRPPKPADTTKQGEQYFGGTLPASDVVAEAELFVKLASTYVNADSLDMLVDKKLLGIITALIARVRELEKRKGIACLKHDLTYTIACGVCLAESQAQLKAVEQERDKDQNQILNLKLELSELKDRIVEAFE